MQPQVSSSCAFTAHGMVAFVVAVADGISVCNVGFWGRGTPIILRKVLFAQVIALLGLIAQNIEVQTPRICVFRE